MSWKSYINCLIEGNCCEKAYLIGKESLDIWASSTELSELKTYEIEIPNSKDYNKMEKIKYNEKEELSKVLLNPEKH